MGSIVPRMCWKRCHSSGGMADACLRPGAEIPVEEENGSDSDNSTRRHQHGQTTLPESASTILAHLARRSWDRDRELAEAQNSAVG